MNELQIVYPHPDWHPSALSARAAIFGVPAPSVENARVLEMDCGDGGNLLSVAASLPESTCWGVSASGEGFDRARTIQEASGLSNISFQEDGGSIEGEFDYIFLRNTYSKFPPDQRNELISFYRGKLSGDGLILVDFMTHPGWNFFESIRRQIRYHTRNFEDPHEKMIAGRQYLSALSQSVPASAFNYLALAKEEWNASASVPDANFGAEYFEENWHPAFFHEFAASLEGHGLQYLCELSLGSMMISRFPAAMGAVLPENAGLIESEQYLDFVTNRTRRQSLLCRDSLEVQRQIEPATCRSLYFSAFGMPEDPNAIFEEEQTVLNGPAGGQVTLIDPAGKAALLALTSQFPRRFSFEQVCQAVRDGIGELAEGWENAVADTLAGCAVSGIVQIDAAPSRASNTMADQPVASPLAIAQAESGEFPYVSSLHHRTIEVDQTAAFVLSKLDGNHDAAALAEQLRQQIEQGVLILRDEQGAPVNDPAAIAEAAEQRIPNLLQQFLGNGLLVS